MAGAATRGRCRDGLLCEMQEIVGGGLGDVVRDAADHVRVGVGTLSGLKVTSPAVPNGPAFRVPGVARGWSGCEFGAEGGGVGVVEVFEDGEGAAPGVAGFGAVSRGVVGVADVGQDL